MSNVSGVIKSIQDIMRKDVGVDGDAQRISQLVWMFFLKIFDDREAELELLEDDYKSPLPEHLRWRAWATNPEGMTGDALADFVNVQVFPYLKEKLPTAGAQGKRAQVVRSVFEDAYNYMKSGTLMRQVINKICEIDFNNSGDRHTFGSIYEQILRDLQSAGNAGEFYTPRAVTRFIVNRVDPKLDETVLDPACGTGGFLTCAIDHKREHYLKTREDEETLVNSIRGYEKKALPHMLAVTNMILHGIDTPTNIKHDNTLSRPYKDYGNADRVNVIITNPPFGGMEEDGIENNFPAHLRTRETADLFMALVIKLLKDQGRAAVVLPDGFLFGEGMKTRLKQILLEECNLHTIVRLPNGVFAPYTAIKTNLLFFTKGQPTEHVWYYEHPYPDGVKSYNKTKPMRFEEFETEIAWWGDEADGFAARVQTEHAWKVPVADIVARNYNLDIKNPHVGEQISHDPDELLQKYQMQQNAIAGLRDRLKQVLQEAFGSWRRESMSKVITENLELWTSTLLSKSGAGRGGNGKQEAYGINKLRELILELAVRGRLVPQDTNDEPASDLLKKAIAEKNRLISEGSLRDAKPPAAPDESPAYELPSSWVWTCLYEIGEIAPRNEADASVEASFVPMQAISEEYGVPVKHEVKPWGEIKSGFTHFREEDVVLAKITPCFQNGKSAVMRGLTNGFGAGTTELHVYRSICACTVPEYVLIYLKSPRFISEGVPKMTGTAGQKRITRDYFAGNHFPLPPIDEQHRIVAKVDELMAFCDALTTHLIDAQTTQIHLADAIVEQAVC